MNIISNEMYVIVFTDKNGNLNYCDMGECGYPHTSTYFSFNNIFYSKEHAQEAINCWNQFNMWCPKKGFSAENVKIKKLNINLIDV